MKWTLERKKLSQLTPQKNNPRTLSKHDAHHLRASLDKFGVCEPIVCNRDGTIIGGHQRFKTLKAMGVKDVDVYTPDRDLTPKETQELTIRLNRNAGEWDFDLLANAFNLDELIEWGFTNNELLFDQEEEHPTEDEVDIEKTVFSISVVDHSQFANVVAAIRPLSDMGCNIKKNGKKWE